MTSERLLGRDHGALGELALIGLPGAAIGLSRGGAPKRYAYTDPNEDAVGFAHAAGGWLFAVADGHNGAACAALAVEHLIDRAAPALLTPAPAPRDERGWCDALYQAFQAANAEILRAQATSAFPVGETTLSAALVLPSEGLLVHASVGDSHVFVVDSESASDVGWQSLGLERCHFLGFPEEPVHRSNTALGCLPLRGLRALVLASDGLSEQGIGVPSPSGVVAECTGLASSVSAERRPIELCRAVAEAASDAQRENGAGDNIAVATLLF